MGIGAATSIGIATVGAFSTATDGASQLLTTGRVNWEQAAISGGIGALAGGHLWRAEDVGRVEALGRSYDPARENPTQHAALMPDAAHAGAVKAGLGGSADEATSAMRLEHAGLIQGPLQNATVPEVDLVDGHGAGWDVKTPQDIYPGRSQYTLANTLNLVRSELQQGHNVILNISCITRANAHELITAVRSSPEFAGRVLVSTAAHW